MSVLFSYWLDYSANFIKSSMQIIVTSVLFFLFQIYQGLTRVLMTFVDQLS